MGGVSFAGDRRQRSGGAAARGAEAEEVALRARAVRARGGRQPRPAAAPRRRHARQPPRQPLAGAAAQFPAQSGPVFRRANHPRQGGGAASERGLGAYLLQCQVLRL